MNFADALDRAQRQYDRMEPEENDTEEVDRRIKQKVTSEFGAKFWEKLDAARLKSEIEKGMK